MMNKTLLGISAAAMLSLTTMNANASDTIDINNKDDQSSISHSAGVFSQPAIKHITTEENKNTTSQLSPQNDNNIDRLSQLPDEIKLHVLQQLPIKDMIKLAATNHSWQNILYYGEISQAIAFQRLYPTHNLQMSDLAHPIIKAALTGKAKLTVRKKSEIGNLYAIKNNGEFFLRNTLNQPDVRSDPESLVMCRHFHHEPISLATPIGRVDTSYASTDGMIRAGTAYIDNTQTKAFITTDQKTVEFLPIPAGVSSSNVKDISATGLIIVGNVELSRHKEHGFRWTRQNGMTILSKDSPESDVKCISFDGSVIGGSTIKNRVHEPAIWLNDTKAFCISDLFKLSHRPEAEGVKFIDVYGISSNNKILWGIGYKSSGQIIWTLDCSEDQAAN